MITRVFVDNLEIGELFDGGLIDKVRSAHQIDLLELFLQSSPWFLKALFLKDGLMLINYKYGCYTYYLAYCLIIFFFMIQHYIDEDVWHELYSHESFLDEVLLNSFDCKPLFSYNCLPASMLSNLAYGIRFPSCIVRQIAEDYKGFVLGLYFV